MNHNKRPMNQTERANLTKLKVSLMTRLKIGIENFVVIFSVILFAAFIIGALAVWILEGVFRIGIKGDTILLLLIIAVSSTALFSVASTVKWLKGSNRNSSLIINDIADGAVIEESYLFTEAMRFQEPEHGGLLYCLRSSGNKVFVIYDPESQDLGANGKDPLDSSFLPQAELVVVRAPSSGVVLSKIFTGAVLDAGDVKDMILSPDKWPEQDAVCSIPWSKLERRLSGNRTHNA